MKHVVDKSQIIIPEGTMEDFQRPSHPDFMDSSEIRKAELSGIRHNSITGDCEIWVDGRLEASVSQAQVQLNPRAIDEAYARVFGLDCEVAPDIPALKQYKHRNQEKK